MKSEKPRNGRTPSQAGSVLEHWQQESMLDQPYHNLKWVKVRADLEIDKESADRKKDSSMESLDFEDSISDLKIHNMY